MVKDIKSFLIIFAILFLISCQQQKHSGPPVTKTDIPPSSFPIDDPVYTVTASKLAGEWESECRILSDKLSYKSLISFKGEKEWTNTESYFWNDVCEELEYKYVYKYETTFIGLSELNSQKINLKLLQINIVPLSDALVDFANSYTACGYDNWGKNSTRDATGKDCNFFGIMPAQGTVSYEIVSVADGELFLGEKNNVQNGKSEANRPILFSSNPYKLIK